MLTAIEFNACHAVDVGSIPACPANAKIAQMVEQRMKCFLYVKKLTAIFINGF